MTLRSGSMFEISMDEEEELVRHKRVQITRFSGLEPQIGDLVDLSIGGKTYPAKIAALRPTGLDHSVTGPQYEIELESAET